MSKEKTLEERFDTFLFSDDFKDDDGQYVRWLFCDDTPNDKWDIDRPPVDCGCCFSADVRDRCSCICHKRIDRIKAFIKENYIAKEEVQTFDGSMKILKKEINHMGNYTKDQVLKIIGEDREVEIDSHGYAQGRVGKQDEQYNQRGQEARNRLEDQL